MFAPETLHALDGVLFPGPLPERLATLTSAILSTTPCPGGLELANQTVLFEFRENRLHWDDRFFHRISMERCRNIIPGVGTDKGNPLDNRTTAEEAEC